MDNFNKFIILFLCVTPLAGIGMYFSHITPINFEASGIVVDVRWKTSNHNLPLITIRSGTDKPKHFQHVRIILTPEDIKIGDRFSKKSGTNTCSINEVELKCVK